MKSYRFMFEPSLETCEIEIEQLRRLIQLTDSELQQPEFQELRRHLDTCKRCASRLDKVLAHSDLNFTKASQSNKLPEELAKRLWASIKQNLPAVEIPPNQLSSYKILQEIGRGGMGIVYRARDQRLDREVALKVLNPLQISASCRARFVREARAMAAMKSEGIVPVFEVLDDARFPAIVMPIMEGGSLAARIELADYTIQQAVHWVRQITNALSDVHANGYVHRDVKPANVLLDRSGRAHLADFGLVRSRSDIHLTEANAILGTPEYLTPESLDTPGAIPTFAGDIYQSGVLLYHLLAGQAPFHGSLSDVLRQISNGDAQPLKSTSARIPKDLDRICSKAMSRCPEDRYATANEFSDDLERFLDGREVLARPTSAIHRCARWLVRHPRASLAAAVVFGFLGTAVTYAWSERWRASQLDRSIERTQGELRAAEMERDYSRSQIFQVVANSAQLPATVTPEKAGEIFLTRLVESFKVGLEMSLAKKSAHSEIATQALALTQLQAKIGHFSDVIDSATICINHLQSPNKTNYTNTTEFSSLCAAKRLLSQAYLETNQLPAAEKSLASYGQSIAAWEKAAPNEIANQFETVTHRLFVARLMRESPEHTRLVNEAFELWQRTAEKESSDLQHQPQLREIATQLASELKLAFESAKAAQILTQMAIAK